MIEDFTIEVLLAAHSILHNLPLLVPFALILGVDPVSLFLFLVHSPTTPHYVLLIVS